MGLLKLSTKALSSVGIPDSTWAWLFPDSSNSDRVKAKHSSKAVDTLSPDGERYRNALTNGGFLIQQRVPTASTAIAGVSTTTRAGVVADRWAITTSVASNLNWKQTDTSGTPETGLASRFYGSTIAATAGKKVMLSQYIPFNDMAHLRGKSCRFQIKLNQKVGSGQTYKLGVIQLNASGTVDTPPAFLSGAWSTSTGTDPSWGTNLAAITPDDITPENGTVSGSYINVTSVATTWTRFSGCFTVPSDCKGLIVVVFANATGGTTDELAFAEADLHAGQEIYEYYEPDPAYQLARCQRFYYKTFNLTTVPAQSAGLNTGEFKWMNTVGATAAFAGVGFRFPVPMFKAPVTLTLYNPSAANAQIRNVTDSNDCTGSTATANGEQGCWLNGTTATGNAAGEHMAVHLTADCEFVA